MDHRHDNDGIAYALLIILMAFFIVMGFSDNDKNDDRPSPSASVTVASDAEPSQFGQAYTQGMSPANSGPTEHREISVPRAITSPDLTPSSLVPSDEIGSSDLFSENITTPNANPSASVTDFSYWRLVRQGMADVIPGTETMLQHNSNHTFRYLSGELDLTDTNIVFLYLGITDAQLNAEPGTVISVITYDQERVVISIPKLPEDLQGFIDERGDSCIMSYIDHGDGTCETEVFFYQTNMRCLFMSSLDLAYSLFMPSLDLMYNAHHNIRIGLVPDNYQVVYSMQYDIVRAPNATTDGVLFNNASIDFWDPGNTGGQFRRSVFCNGCSIDTFGNMTPFETADQDLGFGERTETSFTPTPAQIQLLKDTVADYEAMPLPDFLLEGF